MSQLTKKAIMASFVRLVNKTPLDKITVKDIVEDCGVNRNTFYYYYCDVYALIRELMEVRAQQLITDNQEDLNWIEITREVTSFFRTHRRTVYLRLRQHSGGEGGQRERAQDPGPEGRSGEQAGGRLHR